MTYRFTVDLTPIGVEFEVGSIEEGLGALQDAKSTLIKVKSIGTEIVSDSAPNAPPAASPTAPNAPTAPESDESKGKRGRPSKKELEARAAAAATAAPVAPPAAAAAPVAPPAAAAPVAPPVGDHGIPPELVRANQGISTPTFIAPVAEAPTPIPPPAPPAPVAPPSSELADKIIAHLRTLKDQAPDGGAAYAAWLTNPDPAQGYGVASPGAALDEVLTVLRFTTEEKLKQIATALRLL